MKADIARRGDMDRHETYGREGHLIKASLADDASRAAEILQPYKITLTAAANFFTKAMKEREGSKPLSYLLEKNIEHKQGLSSRYLKELTRISAKLSERLGDSLVCDITKDMLSDALSADNPTPTTFNTARNYIRPAFSHVVEDGLAKQNVAELIRLKPQATVKEVDILSLDEVRAVLSACRDHRSNEDLHPVFRLDCTDCAAGFAIMTFAGVRPQELCRLEWSDVNLDERMIRISGRKAKTKSTRIIEIEDNLALWIGTVPQERRKGSITGANWSKRYKAVRKAAGISDRQDVLRHSFASYYLAAYEDIKALRSAMGHASPDVLYKHYRSVVTKKEALQFWQILPAGTKATTIRAVS